MELLSISEYAQMVSQCSGESSLVGEREKAIADCLFPLYMIIILVKQRNSRCLRTSLFDQDILALAQFGFCIAPGPKHQGTEDVKLAAAIERYSKDEKTEFAPSGPGEATQYTQPQ